jgi:hypothetical protein
MGGMGSGSFYRWSTADTTDDYRSIDVRRWKPDGLLDLPPPKRQRGLEGRKRSRLSGLDRLQPDWV